MKFVIVRQRGKKSAVNECKLTSLALLGPLPVQGKPLPAYNSSLRPPTPVQTSFISNAKLRRKSPLWQAGETVKS